MHASESPEEVFRRLVAGVAAQRGEELAELYAPNAVVEHPLDPVGAPLLRGREALRDHFRADDEAPGAPRLRPADIVVHHTTDAQDHASAGPR